jgi:hypothetical protein
LQQAFGRREKDMAVQNSTRKWVFVGVGVVAAAALVVFFQNYPPQSKDAAGAIGAAQRYHSTQITGVDVKVSQDELTTWIQSDTFDRIVRDPQARKLFADAAVISMFNDAAHKFDAARNLDADGMRVKQIEAQLDAARNLNTDGMRVKQIEAQLDAARNLYADAMSKQTGMRLLDGARTLQIEALDNAALRNAYEDKAFLQAISKGNLMEGLVNQARIADTSGSPE